MPGVVEDEHALADVLHDVLGNLDRIVRDEVRFAKVEAMQEMGTLARSGGASARNLLAGVKQLNRLGAWRAEADGLTRDKAR
jgi:hypothetical protein